MNPIRIVPKHYKNTKIMKRKILALALTSMFTLGLIASINTNKTNQEKNIKILQNSNAKSYNCTLDGSLNCPLYPDYNEKIWRVWTGPYYLLMNPDN